MSEQNIKIRFGESTIICVKDPIDTVESSKGFSPACGFIGVVTDVVHAGEYVKLDFDGEIRQVTIKHADFRDWMEVGARLKIDWFSSIFIELITAPTKLS